MADGGYTVDRVQIEIEASASDASSKINALNVALQKLQDTLNKGFNNNIVKQLNNISKGVSSKTDFIKQGNNAKKQTSVKDATSDIDKQRDIDLSLKTDNSELEKANEILESFGKNIEPIEIPAKVDVEDALDKSKMPTLEIPTKPEGITPEEVEKESKLPTLEIPTEPVSTGKSVQYDSAKLDLNTEKAEIKTGIFQNRLNELKARLQELQKMEGLGPKFEESLATATQKISEFESKVEDTKQSADDIGSIDIKTTGTKEINDIISAFKIAQGYAVSYGQAATDALGRAERAARKAASEQKKLASEQGKTPKVELPESILSKGLGRDFNNLDVSVAKSESLIEDLQNRLRDLYGAKGFESGWIRSLEDVDQKLADFKTKAETAKSGAEMIKDALEQIRSGSLDLTNEQLKELVYAFKDAQSEARAAGETISSAMKSAEKSASNAEKGLNKFLNQMQKVSSGKELKGLDSQFSKLQKQLDSIKASTGDWIVEVPEFSQASVDMDKFKDAIENAREKSEKLKDAIDKVRAGTLDLPVSTIREMAREYQNAASAAKEAGEAASSSVQGAGQSKAGNTSEQLSSLVDILKKTKGAVSEDGAGKALNELLGSDVMSGLSGEMSTLVGSSEALSGALSTISAAAPYVQVGILGLKIAFETAKSGINSFVNDIKKAGSIISSVLKPAIDAVSSGLKQMSNSFKSAASGAINSFASGLKNIGKDLTSKFTEPFQKAIKFVNKWKNSLGRIAFYRAIRSAIKAVTDGFKEGIENLYQYSRLIGTDFAPSMDRLATSALYLKNSLGAMAAPLINAIAPVVDMLIDKFVALLNVIGKVFAVLTGKNVYSQAKKYATEYADAAGGASKATKDFLLGIDELNVINEDTGGGAGGGLDYSDMFEEVEIGEEFDWAREIREAIEAGEWEKAGELLAEKLNDVIEKFDAKDWGNKLGEKINNGIDFAYGFVKKFDGEKLGGKIADGLWGILEKIDPYTLGSLIGESLNTLFDIVDGFSQDIPWEKVGNWIADGITGFIDALNPESVSSAINSFFPGVFQMLQVALEKPPWETLGEKFAQILNDIKWYEITYNGLIVIKDAIDAVKRIVDGVLENWNFVDTAEQIKNAFKDALSDESWFQDLGETVGNAINAALAFVTTLLDKDLFLQIGRDIGQFLVGMGWDEIFDGLADAVAAGINAAIALVSGLLDIIEPEIENIVNNISQSIQDFFNNDVDWEELGNVISRGIKLALSFIAGLLDEDTFYAIGKAIAEFLLGLDWPGLIAGLGEVLANGIKSAVALVSGFLDTFKPNMEQLAKDIATKINEFVASVDWAELGQTINDGINTALDFLISILDQLDWDSIGNAIGDFLTNLNWPEVLAKWQKVMGTAIGGALKGINLDDAVTFGGQIISGLIKGAVDRWLAEGGVFGWIKKTIFSPFIEGFKSLFGIHSPSTVMEEQGGYLIEGLLNGVSAAWESITGFFSDAWEGIKSLLSGIWDSLKTTASEKFTAIKDAIGTAWDNVKTKASEIWGNVKETLTTTWDNLKDGAKEKFDLIKTHISDAWDKVKETSKTTWDNIKETVSTTWENLKTGAQEKFESIKNSVSEAWENAKTKSKETWDNIKETVGETWENLKTSAKEKFDFIKDHIVEKWKEVTDNTESSWKENHSKVTDALKNIGDSVTSKFSELASDALAWGKDMCKNISDGISAGIDWVKNAAKGVADKVSSYLHFSEPDEGPLSDFHTSMPDMMQMMADGIKDNTHLVTAMLLDAASSMKGSIQNVISDAITWGRDICKGLADGISGAAKFVKDAVSNVADTIKDFIGFSEPKEGPLSNFHTYMPDMMDLMAKGIRENASVALNEVSNVASSMADTLQNVKMPEDLGFPEHQNAYVQYQADYSAMDKNRNYTTTQDVNESFTADMRDANGDVVSTLISIASQIVTAIEENKTSVSLDGKTLSNSVDKYKRQSGASIMAGGVFG